MIKTTLIAATAALATTALAAPAEARVNKRQDNQQARIIAGAQSGALTARETKRLIRQQAHIQRYETRSRLDGPGLTKRERVRLEAMQDRASRNMARQKRDRQRR